MQQKKYFLFLTVLLFSIFKSPGHAIAQTGWKWGLGSVQVDSTIYDEAAATIDRRGNIIMAGLYDGGDSMILGTSVIHFSGKGLYLLITKTDTFRHLLWAVKAKNIVSVAGIQVDDTGNVYVAGTYDSLISFGSYNLSSSTHGNCFLVKMSPTGNVIWGISTKSTGVRSLAIDKENSLYMTGFYSGPLTVGGVTLAGSGSHYSIFIEKFSSSGSFIWLKGVEGGSCNNYLINSTVSENGTTYLCGSFVVSTTDTTYWHINVGGTVLTAPSTAYCPYIVKMDSSGRVLWAHYISENAPITAMIADKKDNFYATGYFKDTVTLGSVTFTSAGMQDMFLSSYDSSGRIVWTKSAGGTRNDFGSFLALDSCGSLWVAGGIGYIGFTGPDSSYFMTFSSGSNLHALYHSSDPLFIARYDTSGSYFSSIALQSGGDDNFFLGPDNRGNLFVAGDFYRTTLVFGSDTLLAPDSNYEYLFIAKYNYDNGGCYANNVENITGPIYSDDVVLYPNPTQNELNITSSDKITDISVVNLLGQVMYKNVFDSRRLQLDLSRYPAGVYLVKMNGNIVRRVVKE